MLKERRHPMRPTVVRVEQGAIRLDIPERGMQVEGAARLLHVPLRHEGDRDLVEGRDLLDAVLVDDVTVAHFERFCIPEVDLLLPEAPFTFAVLDRNSGRLHPIADQPVEPLGFGPLEDVIVLDISPVRLEAVVILGSRLLVAIPDEEELQLRATLGVETEFLGTLDLTTQ